MKTKEITCYVSPSFLTDGVRAETVYQNSPCGNYTLKARVKIEIPEKRKVVTESALEQAMTNVGVGSNMRRYLKKELGFYDE